MLRYIQIAGISLIVVILGGAGLAKLIQPGQFVEQFAGLGLPAWFVKVTGAVELVGAALVSSFNAKRRRYGGLILCATMATAAFLHLIHDPAPLAVPALLLMSLAAWVAFMPFGSRQSCEASHA